MAANSFDAHVVAVQKEIGRQTYLTAKKPQGFAIIKLLSAALVFMVVTAWVVHRPSTTDAAADINVIMQQARHEVHDYYHRYGRMPEGVSNPALRPYVEYVRLSDDSFELTAKLGELELRH